MKNEATIDELMAQLDEKIAWFHGDEFRLEEAKARFLELNELAKTIESRLFDVKNEIEVLAKDFGQEAGFTE